MGVDYLLELINRLIAEISELERKKKNRDAMRRYREKKRGLK